MYCPYLVCDRSSCCQVLDTATFKQQPLGLTRPKQVVSLPTPRWGFFGFMVFVCLFCGFVLFFFKLHPLYKQNQRLRNWSRIHTTGLRPVTWKPASNRLISVPPCKIYFPYFETKKVFVIGFY